MKNEARIGVIGHHVSYVLAFSPAGDVTGFPGVGIYCSLMIALVNFLRF